MIKQILKFYNNASLAAKSAVAFTICNVLQKGIAIVTTPLFTRIMTTEQYGLATLYNAWSSIFSIFVTLNLSMGVFNNGMVKFEDNRDAFTSSLAGLSTLLAFFALGFVLIISDFLFLTTRLSKLLIYTMFATYLVSPSMDLWASRQRFEFNYKRLVIITLTNVLLTILISSISVIIFTHKGEAKIISTSLVTVIISLTLYIELFKRGKTFYKKEYWKYVLAFNIPLIPHYLSSILLNQADRIMIARYCGDSWTGIYNVAYGLAMSLYLVCSAVGNAFIPWLYRRLKARCFDDVSTTYEFLIIIIGVIALIIIIFAPELMIIMAPQEYYQGVWAIPPITLGAFLLFVYQMFSNVEIYYEKNRFIAIASTSIAILNIILNYIFIKPYGYIACAYTTFFCYFIFAGIHNIFANYIFKQENPGKKLYNIKNIWTIYGIVIILGLSSMALYQYRIFRYLIVLGLIALMFYNRKRFISKFAVLLEKGE